MNTPQLESDQIRKCLVRLFTQLAQGLESGDIDIPSPTELGFDAVQPHSIIDLITGDYIHMFLYMAATLDEAERDNRMERVLEFLTGRTQSE